MDRLDKSEIQSLVDKLSSYLDEPRVKPDDLLKVGRTLEFGIPYLVEGVWKNLKLDRFFQEELKKRSYEKPVYQAILGMVMNRCQHPYSKRSTEVKTGQSWEQISRLFRQLHVVELITEAGSVFRRSELFKEQKAVLKVLDISLPNEIQNVLIPSG